MIEIQNVRKCFQEQEVLKGISFTASNETIGLLGANGAGKTTLLKCMLNILEFEGSIRISGYDVKTQAMEAKRRMSYIPQYFPLWGNLSVEEAMHFVAKLRLVSRARERRLLEEFELAEHTKKNVAALSGGMRQKLSIVIALLSDPEVILLDEPTASLDSWATSEIIRILQSWRGNKTVILSSHRLEEVRTVADRLIQISGGMLVQPEEVKCNHSF